MGTGNGNDAPPSGFVTFIDQKPDSAKRTRILKLLGLKNSIRSPSITDVTPV
jgi:hypothetical protein